MDSIPHALHKILIERAASAALPTPNQSTDSTPPPPYSATAQSHPNLSDPYDFYDSNVEDSEDSEDSDPSPVTLTLNTGPTITGSNNIISTLSSPLADATRFSALLLAAVQSLNAKAEEAAAVSVTSAAAASATEEGSAHPSRKRALRPLQVNLIINAGITVNGDRNVVGNAGIRRAVAAPVVSAPGNPADGSGPVEGIATAAVGSGAAATTVDTSSIKLPNRTVSAQEGTKRRAEEMDVEDEEEHVAKRTCVE